MFFHLLFLRFDFDMVVSFPTWHTKMKSERAALISLLSLQSKRRRVSEAQARKYFQQLIDGIDFCHSKGVYHRDLKVIFLLFWNPSFCWYVLMISKHHPYCVQPENLLLDSQGNLKISDFGLGAQPPEVNISLTFHCNS